MYLFSVIDTKKVLYDFGPNHHRFSKNSFFCVLILVAAGEEKFTQEGGNDIKFLSLVCLHHIESV